MGDSLRLDDVRKSLTSKNLFLSHSLSDLGPAKAAVNLLEKHGAEVYLDVEDVSIRNSATSKDIASRLRTAIRHCKRLVVIVTENTQTSRWIPWEMGIADVEFGESRVALLPAKASASASELWVQQEYFDLYARIEPRAGTAYAAPAWFVRTSDGNWLSLNDWLSRTKPSRY